MDVFHAGQRGGLLAGRDLLVDLGQALALAIGAFAREELEKAHPEGVDIHELIVVLFEHLGGHEFGRADRHMQAMVAGGAVEERGRPEIPDLEHGARAMLEEDVLALEVSVDDRGRGVRVHANEAQEDLARPRSHGLAADAAVPEPEPEERGRAKLGDEVDLSRLFVHPKLVKLDDIGVV